MINTVIQYQAAKIKTNRLTFLLIVVTALIVIFIGFKHHAIKQGVAYLLVMWLCSFFVDMYVIIRPAKNDFEVKNPKQETSYFCLSFFFCFLFFYIRFFAVADWAHLNKGLRLATVPLLLFVFPIALAIVMLLLKYKPKDLGLRLQGLIIVIPIIIISAITNRLVSPESLTWHRVVSEEGGIVMSLFTGFITAGLSEEFFRVIGQTRIGALLKNKGLGWFIATFIWAFMHFPKWYSEEHNFAEALIGSLRIIPIGLMWGYMTHRTKSFLPAVFIHGTNFWGLQNF